MKEAQRILIVDDEKDLCELLQDRLSSKNYEVFIANNGFEAMDKAEAFRPNLILLDLMMPNMNGHQVCRALRKNANTAHIQIVMLTAKNQPYDRKKAQEEGVSAFLPKPFEMEELEATIEKVLDSKRES